MKKAVVIDDKIEIRPMMNCTFSLDHRYGDASLGVNLIRVVKAYFEDPENFILDNYPDQVPYHELSRRKKQ